MFRQVVAVRWAEGVTPDVQQGFRDALDSLRAIPELLALTWGDDAGHFEGNFDVVAVMDLADCASARVYVEHPPASDLRARPCEQGGWRTGGRPARVDPVNILSAPHWSHGPRAAPAAAVALGAVASSPPLCDRGLHPDDAAKDPMSLDAHALEPMAPSGPTDARRLEIARTRALATAVPG